MKQTRQKRITWGLPLLLAGALFCGCSVEDKAGLHGNADVLFTLGGVAESQDSQVETRSAVIDTATYHVLVPLKDGLDMECIFRAEEPFRTKAFSSFDTNNTFHIFSDNGSSVTSYGPYTSGSGNIRLTGLTAGTYTFSAYSFNNQSTIPVLSAGSSTIDNIVPANDLLHWVQSGTTTIPAGSGTNHTIRFRHKLPQVRVVVNAKDKISNASLPISAIVARLNPNHYVKMDVRDGSLSAGSSGVHTSLLSWSTSLPASSITSNYQSIYTPSSGAVNLVFTMPSVTVDGTVYNDKSVTFNALTLSDNYRYTMTVNIKKAGVNPDDLELGTGSFSGKTCFDIAQGNDNTNGCASINSRNSQKTDFSIRTIQDPIGTNASVRPFTGVQVYTYTPSGTVSNVRFVYIDASGKVIELLTPQADYSGTNISSPCKVTVAYKSSLNDDLRGLTRSTALKAILYVIYNNAANGLGTDVKLPLSVTLMDCACCGAATVNGGWLNFMCHNLGADESLDPFTYVSNGNTVSNDVKGTLYQWGRKEDGHQLRNSSTTSTLAFSNTPNHNKFITTTSSPFDWRSGGGAHTRWGDGTTSVNPAKASNDPCPPGWKIPSKAQWQSIYKTSGSGTPSQATANNWTWTTSGFKVGDALFLPAAGHRSGDFNVISSVGAYGYYWSSTSSGVTSSWSNNLTISENSVEQDHSSARASGLSVRCVEE